MRSTLTQRLLNHIRKQRYLRAGDRVGVAVSGGADSVALLLLLLELHEKLGLVLNVVHFNHKLRGKASDDDEKFVSRLAVRHGLAFQVAREDVAAKARRERTNLEDAARRARYSFFTKLMEEGQLECVAVAHTADDQAETVLAHILRGTGLAGLGGIHPIAGQVVRPLLNIRRAELRAYLRAKKQSWREDLSNQDLTRMRARIRRKLLPLLEKQFQPAVVEHLVSLAELARVDEAFFEMFVESRMAKAVQKKGAEFRIRVSDLLTLTRERYQAGDTEVPTALGSRLVRQLVARVKQRGGEMGAKHVESVLELAGHGQRGKSLQLPGGVEVWRDGDDLVFAGQDPSGRKRGAGKPAPREYEYKIDLGSGETNLRVPELGCAFRVTVIDWPPKRGETKDTGAVLDRDRLHFPLLLRNWRPGDKLRPQGHQKAHKLKRLFNQKRISRSEREGWPVLTSGGVLAWARGFRVAAEFAVQEGTEAGIVIAEESL